MLIWSGAGFIVPIITFGCLLASEAGIETWLQDDVYYQSHAWPKMLAFLVAAGLIRPVGLMLDRRGGRTLLDPKTGELLVIGGNHTFFFIPVKWWPVVCLALGAGMFFVTT